MSLLKSLSLVGPAACSACLALGYALIEQWSGLVVVSLSFVSWLLARQKPDTMSPSAPLVFSVAMAAGGLLVGAAPLLMILAAALALASWDVVLLHHTLADSSSSSTATISLFQRRHFQYLALALGPSLLLAFAGRSLHFQVPFGIMVFLAIVVLFGLDRILRTLIDVR